MSPLFETVICEINNAFAKCICHQEFYDVILQQITSMEEFSGHDYTMNVFYTSQPLMSDLLCHLEVLLFEIGFGKLSTIRPWLSELIFDLFREMGTIHKNHTKSLAPKNLGAPSLYRPPPIKKTSIINTDTAADKNDVWTEDDLYV